MVGGSAFNAPIAPHNIPVTRVNEACLTQYNIAAKYSEYGQRMDSLIAPYDGSKLTESELHDLCGINHDVSRIQDESGEAAVRVRLDLLARRVSSRKEFSKYASHTSRYCPPPQRNLSEQEYMIFEKVFFDDDNKYKELESHEKEDLCELLRILGNSDGNDRVKGRVTEGLVKLRTRIHSFVSMAGLKSWWEHRDN